MNAGNKSIAHSTPHVLLFPLLQVEQDEGMHQLHVKHSDLIQVFLSDVVHLSPVVLPQLLQLPLVITLHFLPHFLENISQLDSDGERQFTV